VGFVPVLLLTIRHGLQTKWRETPAGRSMFYLFASTTFSYGLTLTVLFFPDFFRGEAGEWVRIVLRLLIGAVLWNVYRIFVKAQKSGDE
jgi:hypothetical protein